MGLSFSPFWRGMLTEVLLFWSHHCVFVCWHGYGSTNPGGSVLKNPPAKAGDARYLEDPWSRTWQPSHRYSCLGLPWTQEPSGLQSMGLQTAKYNWATEHHTHGMGWTPRPFSAQSKSSHMCSQQGGLWSTMTDWILGCFLWRAIEGIVFVKEGNQRDSQWPREYTVVETVIVNQ